MRQSVFLRNMIASLRRLPRHIFAGLGLFFVITVLFVAFARGGVNSPDEAANKVFIQQWADHSRLSIDVKHDQTSSYPLFPRSTSPDGAVIRPSGFAGLVLLYGSIASVIGLWSAAYLTILFTMIAAIAWWYLMRKIFDERIADCAFWLFLFHPAVLYYSVRGLFPNMLLMDMLIMAVAGAWFAITRWQAGERGVHMWAMGLCTMFFAVVAALVRPPETFMTLGVAAVMLAIVGGKQFRRGVLIGLVVLLYAAGILWLLRAARVLPGYTFVEATTLWTVLFPFGIDIGNIWYAGTRFVIKLFSPWVLISTAGALLWIYRALRQREFDKKIGGYLITIFVVSLWLFGVYGSWRVSDNTGDPNAVTMGASYVRYWLPHLIFRMPFAAYLLFEIAKLFPRFGAYVFRACVAGAVIFGLLRALVGVDGLVDVTKQVRAAARTVAAVSVIIPSDAVLAVRTWDKHFFPAYDVIQPFPRDIRTYAGVRELLGASVPVWAFIEALSETDLMWLRTNDIDAQENSRFDQHGLYQLHIWNGGQQ